MAFDFWGAFREGQEASQIGQQFAANQAYSQQKSQATANADIPANTTAPDQSTQQIDATSDGGYGTPPAGSTSPNIANPTPAAPAPAAPAPAAPAPAPSTAPVAKPSSLPDPKSQPDPSDTSDWAKAGASDTSAKPSKLGSIADALKSLSTDQARQQQATSIGTGAGALGAPPTPAGTPAPPPGAAPVGSGPTSQGVPQTPASTYIPFTTAGNRAANGGAPLTPAEAAEANPPGSDRTLGAAMVPPTGAPNPSRPYVPFGPAIPNAPDAARGAAMAANSPQAPNTPPVALNSVTGPSQAGAIGGQPSSAGSQAASAPSGNFTPDDPQAAAAAGQQPATTVGQAPPAKPPLVGSASVTGPNTAQQVGALPPTSAPLAVTTPSGQTEPAGSQTQASVGSKILSYLNPVSDAEAAPAKSALPPAKEDEGDSPAAESKSPPKAAVQGTPASQGATPTPTGTTALPAPAAKVAPNQQGASQQSEAPVAYPKDPIDPRPLAAAAKDAPEYFDKLNQIAAQNNISPARLAAHWNNESDMAPTAPDHKNADGSVDIGPFQINSKTLPELDPSGTIDPRTFEGGAQLAARYIQTMDARFGKDTFLSVAAYNGGPGASENIFNGKPNPAVMSYASKIFMGRVPTQFQPPMQVDPTAAVQAAQKEGPEGMIRMLAQTNPGAPMGDKWRSVEAAGIYAALLRGDQAGAAQVRDDILNLQNAGANQAMMGAYKALQVGNGVAAAQYLAKAHAFVPDDSMGRFGVDAKGQVWGEMLDEATGKPMGRAFQVTPNALQTMMMQTRDPAKFSAMADENAKTQASIKFMQDHGNYFGDLVNARVEATKERLQAAQLAAGASDYRADQGFNGRVGAALVRGPSHGGAMGFGPQQVDPKLQQAANTELANPKMTPLINGINDPQQGQAARVAYADMRAGGGLQGGPVDLQSAQYYTMGLMHGTYKIASQGANSFLVDTQNNPVARISPHVAAIMGHILRPQPNGRVAATPPRRSAMNLNLNTSAIPSVIH